MKRLGLAVLVVFLFCLVSVSCWAGTKIITGYAIGEFAVKDQIAVQAVGLVAEIKNTQQPDQKLRITVVGSADSSGLSAANDKLAKERAEEIAAVLHYHFPEAEIIVWSAGAGQDSRQVEVDWKFVPVEKAVPLVSAPVVVPQTELQERESQSKKIIFWSRLLIGIVILLLFFLWFGHAFLSYYRKRRTAKEETRVIHLVIEGVKYSVPLQKKGGMWFLPFMTLENSDVPLFRANFQDAKKAVKGCLKHEKYAGQKEELIKSRVIGII